MTKSNLLIKNVHYLMQYQEIYSVTELAKRLKMQQSTLQRLITAGVKEPSYSTLKIIANFFGHSVTELMEDNIQENYEFPDYESTPIRHNDEGSNK
ncbi:helix-turn-helix domain-containing protein, partial [Xenorhabdus bovienii]|uniref:helix-turn-helix domain-containing protein n=1 Tax=Xenorhabdus bovienii TaxID=40576 RepID=UPI0023B30A72